MFGIGRPPAPPPGRRVLLRSERPAFVYAVGDIHGCLSQLLRLEDRIAEHVQRHGRGVLVVYLGDLVDRGPHSARVVEHLCATTTADPTRIVLSGNHEAMFLDFLATPHPSHSWLKYGGVETLHSYGIDASNLFDGGRSAAASKLASHIPEDHLAFLRELPACISWPDLTLVHAGLREGVAIGRQSVDDMMWLRFPTPAFSAPQPFGLLVHGHTPSQAPVIEPFRICIDTGAFATGILSAVAIDRSNGIDVLTS